MKLCPLEYATNIKLQQISGTYRLLLNALYTQLNFTCSVIHSNQTQELTEAKNKVPCSDEGFDVLKQQKDNTDDIPNDNMMNSAQSQVQKKLKRTFNFQL